MIGIPSQLVIPHDDFRGRFVGKAAHGDQFFITTPFVWLPASREFVALYLFDHDGHLKRSEINDLGPRDGLVGQPRAAGMPGYLAPDNARSSSLINQHLTALGPHTFQDIVVKPFEVEAHGLKFGLIPSRWEEDGQECLWVEVMPGNYMAFTPPWDGRYDT